MQPQLPENILATLLRQYYLPPRCRSAVKCPLVPSHRRVRSLRTSARKLQQHGAGPDQDGNTVQDSRSSIDENGFVPAKSAHSLPTTPESTLDPVPSSSKNIAVLGGGITGLASAFWLSKELANAIITLYEGSDRFGGWLQSKHVNVGNGNVVFEQGPRTIRPHGLAGVYPLELIKKLGLEGEVLFTPRDSIAAWNRFVYYPDHLVRMPGPGLSLSQNLLNILTQPVFKDFIPGLVREGFRPQRSPDLHDESVGSFMQRRLGSTHVGDNLASAVMHGIYAGDIYQLSMRSLFPGTWYREGHFGSILASMREKIFNGHDVIQLSDVRAMEEFRHRPSDIARENERFSASVYTLRHGIGALSDALVTALKANPKVRLRTNDTIKRISFDIKTDSLEISTAANQPPKNFDQVISTIPGRTLLTLTDNPTDLASLSTIHAVTVMVVNLYYTNPSLLPVHGFGYLIPRSVPWDQNPELALGVVFDSDASPLLDSAPGTKITVMLGGHWWDGWDAYPDEGEGAAMAKAILKRHLDITEEPKIVNVGLQRDCIPQYTVGHEERLKKAHEELMKTFKGMLAVAGSSYTGVALNDCVRSARDLVGEIKNKGLGCVTGLERFTERFETRWGIYKSPRSWEVARPENVRRKEKDFK